jgi:hypothetical protein
MKKKLEEEAAHSSLPDKQRDRLLASDIKKIQAGDLDDAYLNGKPKGLNCPPLKGMTYS